MDDTVPAQVRQAASNTVSTESYFVQQHALAVYKSKSPSELLALSDALKIIESLDADGDSNDPETLGITGAIYKRMWSLNDDKEHLRRAIKYYEKGFKIRNDYYTGENYALCLNMMASIEMDSDEKIYYSISAKKVRVQIIYELKDIADDIEKIERPDKKWIYATLSNCHYGLENDVDSEKYKDLFLENSTAKWELETFNLSRTQLQKLLRG